MKGRICLALAIAFAEMGQFAPPSGPTDPRIQLVPYSPDRVVTVQAAMGYAVVVELSEDEHVENLVLGNSAGWQVTANKRGDHLIIKPIAGDAPTDLVITTDIRRYVFLLQASEPSSSTPFVIRFDYPQTAAASPANASPAARYKLHGDKALFPAAMSDDGKRTTVTWGHDTPLPAIFAVDTLGNEAIINGRMVGSDYVIERLAPRFVFRIGKTKATAVRRVIKASH